VVDTEAGLTVTLGLPSGVRVGRDEHGSLHLVGMGRVSLGKTTPELVAAVRELTADRLPVDSDLPLLFSGLEAGGWLRRTISFAGSPLMSERMLPGMPSVEWRSDLQTAVLSRFAVLRRDGDGLVVESPLADRVVWVRSPGVAALISRLAAPVPAPLGDNDLTGTGLPDAAVAAVVRELGAAGLVVPVEETGNWGPHELWFHTRSRWGGRSSHDPVGPSTSSAPPEPPSAPPKPAPGPPVQLYQPDLAEIAEHEPGVTAVLESRTSIRAHDSDNPITLRQVGEFMYRCARVRSTLTYQGESYTKRPYPAGGAAYELRLYLAAHDIAGLERGLYQYDSYEHVLHRLDAAPDAMLTGAALATQTRSWPQAVVVIAARFDEIFRRYQGMGYATTLKNVGVLYQTMYTVATAMGLAPCALGNGDTAAFAVATGLDPRVESSVGEFMLGSRPDGH
jgi:SagB-type dehydrogenase family enzyme